MASGIQNAIAGQSAHYSEDINLDELESALDTELELALSDIELLKEDRQKIGNPNALSETVMNVVWEQFVNQVGAVAGEEFIRQNRGMTLDLRDSAHIQTTDNFKDGKIASHNTEIDYQKRYDDWQDNFQKDENGKVRMRRGRYTDEEVAVLKGGARDFIDEGRPQGSASMHKDHTVSAAEIIRDPEAATHLSQEEQAAFANSDVNLVDLDASANQSKGDAKMEDWLNHERNGQKPKDRFDIDEQELKERDKKAREEYERVKKEGERRSVEAGRKSQRKEAVRMGKKALQGIVMGLLMALLKTIFQKFAAWLKSKSKNLTSFIDSIKDGINHFVKNLKEHLKIAGQSAIGTIATMIFGPIVRTLQKAWTYIKQGAKSVREAFAYIKNPANKNVPFSLKMLEVGKIIIAGVSAAGAIGLGGAIEGALSSVPFFAFEIPILGSLASIIGLFLGGVISGIIGGVAINLIDKRISKKQKAITTGEIVKKNSGILDLQVKKIHISECQLGNEKLSVANDMVSRHTDAAAMVSESIREINLNTTEISDNNMAINDDSYCRDLTPSNNSSLLNDLIADIHSI